MRFALVGAAGFVVQLVALSVLTSLFGVAWWWATVAAVECAILHNFCWHVRWTWREREGSRPFERFVKFHTGTALVSLVGNVATMSILVAVFHLHPLIANGVTVLLLSLANFALADRWVFRERIGGTFDR